jgi:hypothetical protein
MRSPSITYPRQTLSNAALGLSSYLNDVVVQPICHLNCGAKISPPGFNPLRFQFDWKSLSASKTLQRNDRSTKQHKAVDRRTRSNKRLPYFAFNARSGAGGSSGIDKIDGCLRCRMGCLQKQLIFVVNPPAIIEQSTELDTGSGITATAPPRRMSRIIPESRT